MINIFSSSSYTQLFNFFIDLQPLSIMNHLLTIIIYLIIEPKYFVYLHLNLRVLKEKDHSLRYFQIITNQQLNYVDFILKFISILIIFYHQSSIQQLFQFFLLILNLKRHFNSHLITLDLNYSNPTKYFV